MAEMSDYQEALAEADARLDAIAARLNGIANAMASCAGWPNPSQMAYWREAVEEAYDLARGHSSRDGDKGE